MVSFADHVLPVLAVIAVWFVATGLIAWAANRARETFARSLLVAGVAGAAGLVAVVLSLSMEGANGAMLGFAGALAIWGWHELAFLTGGVTGPAMPALKVRGKKRVSASRPVR